MPGSRAICERMRVSWLDSLLVNDLNMIPKHLPLKIHMPCWKRHPGVCVTRDAWCYLELIALGNKLATHLFQGKQVHGLGWWARRSQRNQFNSSLPPRQGIDIRSFAQSQNGRARALSTDFCYVCLLPRYLAGWDVPQDIIKICL